MRQTKQRYERTRVQTDIPAENKTRAIQSEAKACDINHIVSKAYKTGMLPVLVNRQPLPDLPSHTTYQEMLDTVVKAQQAFEQLPAKVRDAFSNDPAHMLKAVTMAESDPEIRKQLEKIGLINPPAEQSAPKGATGGEATAQPPTAPVSAPA